jgi:ubiquinone/menaquinone biosynthesis C-methylase UbiE
VEAKVHRRVQRYGWDKAVEDYDRFWVPRLRSCSERCLALINLQPGERVLDVATGTGIAAFMAADSVGPGGEVVASDISERMVEAVRADAESRGVTNMRFERVDAEDIAFPDASFVAVTCVLGLMYPADPQQAINQIYRVLKPGGRATVCVWGRRDRCGWNAVFPITDARVNSDVCPLFFSLGAPGALQFAFEQAGFTGIEEERVELALDFESAYTVCAAIFAGGPVALAYSKFTPEVRDEVDAEFLDSVAAYRRGDAYDIPGEFVFLRASR